jgi:hypothetical protein
MAHFAQIDGNNVVQSVLVVSNNDVGNLEFPESEPIGIAFLDNLLPDHRWLQTSYNNNFRVRYAGIGYTFHAECGEYGGFAPPADYDYFVFDETTCSFIPPIPYPDDGYAYYWDDATRSWIKLPALTVIG